MQKFKYDCRFGGYEITIENEHIVIASFYGELDEPIAMRFSRDIKALLEHYQFTAWAYISNSPKTVASTPEAYRIFANLSTLFEQTHCIHICYIFDSVIARQQAYKYRQSKGLSTEFLFFDDLASAIAHSQTCLNGYLPNQRENV